MTRSATWLGAIGLVLMLWTPIVSCDRRSAESAKTTETPAGLSETTRQDKVAVTVSVDRQRVRVAEPLALTLEVQAPLQVEVQWPDTARVLSEGFLVDDEGPVETQEGPQGRTWRQRLVIESNRSGQRRLPALTFQCGDKEIATAELPVEVISAIEADGSVDPTQFADIEGPVAVPRPTNYWALGCVAGAVLAVAGLGWYLLARRSARAAEVVPPPPPHVWALGQLDALLVEQLVQRGQVQAFFYRLSDIVRTYIELRFGLMAPEQTTEEFLADVQRSDALRFGHKDMLRAFLTACDLVKFARHEPAGAEIDGSIDAARRFIRETIPVGSAPDGAPAGDSSAREAAA